MRPSLYLSVIALATVLASCAATQPAPEPSIPAVGTIHVEERPEAIVSVAILTDAQARERVGVDLASKGLQAIWIKVENRSPGTTWFLLPALDLDYYSADEVAHLFHSTTSGSGREALHQQLRDRSMRLRLPGGTTNEGFVFTPRAVGGRYVNVVLDVGDRYVSFGFAVPLPDGDFDYENLRFETHYAGREIPDLDLGQLKTELEQFAATASDAKGQSAGDPLNLVLAGPVHEVLTALHRSGWTFTHRITAASVKREIGAALTGSEYATAPVSPLYVFGRKQDVSLQRGRRTISERNHMRLWLAPFRFEGQPVWVGQVSRDIGVKATPKSPILMTHVIDPEVDEAREFVLQSLLARGFVKRFGFTQGVGLTRPDAPRHNLTGDPYFTDGLRLFLQPASDPVALGEVDKLPWESVPGPISFGQSPAARPAGR